jgi:hypothetical protein
MQQPEETIPNADYEALETRCLAELVDQSVDYALMRPSLITALGVSEEDLREWESRSTFPPKVEAVALPDDEEGDFELMPRGGETEFILDDPDAEDEEDEDAEKPEGEEDDDAEDDDDGEDGDDDDDDTEDDKAGPDDLEEDELDDEVGLDNDDVILDDDDGEKD